MDTGFFALANYIEAGLWLVIGLVLAAIAVRRRGTGRRRCWQAAVLFALFGASDVVEAHTGAWWRPWWLLAWKAACVAALLTMLIDYRYRRRTQSHKRIDG